MPFAITTGISRKNHVVDANDDYSSPFAPSGHLAAMADAAIAATRFAGAEKNVVLLPRLSALAACSQAAKALRRGRWPEGPEGEGHREKGLPCEELERLETEE